MNEIDKYIGQFDGIVKERLLQVREIFLKVMPTAQERISYKIPAYFMDSKMIAYYAGFPNHIGLYPGRISSEKYKKLLSKYASGKATIKLPHDQPLPKDVVEKFLKLRIDETKAK